MKSYHVCIIKSFEDWISAETENEAVEIAMENFKNETIEITIDDTEEIEEGEE